MYSDQPGSGSGDGLASLWPAIWRYLVAAPLPASLAIQRHEIPIKRPAGIAVDLVGTGTAWTQLGTTFTLSGVAGASILTTIVSTGTTARLVVATGASTGTLTVSDGTNTATVAIKNYRRLKWIPGLG